MALIGSGPHVSGAAARRNARNRYASIERPKGPGEDGFNKNFVNINGSLTAVPNRPATGAAPAGNTGFVPQQAAGLIGQAAPKSTAPANATNTSTATATTTSSNTTPPQNATAQSGGLPVSQPGGTPPTSASGPQTGLGDALTGTQGNTNNYANTTPTSTPGAVPVITNNVPGSSGPLSQQRQDDHYNHLLWALLNKDQALGGIDMGGNNLGTNGSWNIPDFLKQGGLISQYNTGANTDAQTRGVQANETVAGQLASQSLRNSDLNRIATQDAREAAAASGMLGGSSAAEGAALRASRAAMLPVAQQDAAWYGQTAANNMDAVNRDRLSDQDLRAGLVGQEGQTLANLYEAASDRRWKSSEANQERTWNSYENQLAYLRQSVDREDQQNFSASDREDQQDWNSWQNGLQRTFQQSEAALDRAFQGDQAGLNRAHERQTQFFNAMFGREGTMASILGSIYSNPDLTPEQQNAAATNARNIMGNLWSTFNATLALGIPQIFADPYTQQSGAQQGLPGSAPNNQSPNSPNNQTPGNNQPGPNGYRQNADGSWPSPVIGTNPNGTPRYATQVGTSDSGVPIFQDALGNPIPYP